MLELRDSLESATKEAEQRRQKEEIQNWITNGLANFADILRQNTDDFSTVGNNILRYLVDYMKINQGGIFVYNDDNQENPYLKLIAVYAYNRIKFADKQILPGEGLVGTCLLEKNTIYLKEVPNGYLEITSGLGKANPRNILIVPLKIDNNVLGVIELASFNDIELHEIEFIEKIAESIASALQTVRINEGTQKLLERSKEQAEAMKSQEEEMRQNIEELQATQEEASRKEENLERELTQAHDEISSLRKKIEELERNAVISLSPPIETKSKVTFTEDEENQ
ncbi:MAG: GAF domain-containing protein [Bacteroidales bacterium]|nr:GAF domain-containing protein [Bacteroidales bacterium]